MFVPFAIVVPDETEAAVGSAQFLTSVNCRAVRKTENSSETVRLDYPLHLIGVSRIGDENPPIRLKISRTGIGAVGHPDHIALMKMEALEKRGMIYEYGSLIRFGAQAFQDGYLPSFFVAIVLEQLRTRPRTRRDPLHFPGYKLPQSPKEIISQPPTPRFCDKKNLHTPSCGNSNESALSKNFRMKSARFKQSRLPPGGSTVSTKWKMGKRPRII